MQSLRLFNTFIDDSHEYLYNYRLRMSIKLFLKFAQALRY